MDIHNHILKQAIFHQMFFCHRNIVNKEKSTYQFNRMLVENFVADSRGNSGLMEPPRFINNPLVFSVHEGYN